VIAKAEPRQLAAGAAVGERARPVVAVTTDQVQTRYRAMLEPFPGPMPAERRGSQATGAVAVIQAEGGLPPGTEDQNTPILLQRFPRTFPGQRPVGRCGYVHTIHPM